jgi:hypothetical protein
VDDTLEFVEKARRVSRCLFGTRHRLEVAACVGDSSSDELHPRGVTKELRERGFDTPEHKVGEQLRALAELHVLERLPPSPGSVRAGYSRQPSALWEMAPRLLAELNEV